MKDTSTMTMSELNIELAKLLRKGMLTTAETDQLTQLNLARVNLRVAARNGDSTV